MLDFLAQTFSVLIGLYFSWASPVHTPPQTCGTFQEFEYCDYGGDTASSRVLFVFNGVGHDATGWSRNPVQGKIEVYWRDHHIARPRVITIGKRHLWWYTDISEGQKLNELSEHLDQVFDLKKYREKFIYGDSMGGHNAYRWTADFPERFSAMALSCPAMPLSFSKKPEHIGTWGLNSFADMVISSHYANASLKLNPISQLEGKGIVPHVPRIYIASASEDQLGFYSGAHELALALQQHTRSEVTFEEQRVRHCYIDPSHLAEFLGK